jgi:hypothetical protein
MTDIVHGIYKKPQVLIKLDVEGMEFVILSDLVAISVDTTYNT